MTLHQIRTHPAPVAGCYACRISAVQIGAGALATRTERKRGERAFQENFGRQFHNGDREAYVRLRRDGLQPRSVDGSADLERRATTRFEVETGRVYEDKRGLGEALKVCDDAGFNPLAPSLTPTGP